MKREASAGNKLVKNTIIYMIGNLGSKILQVLILPLVTSVLLTEEYGYYDLIITTISLVTPLVTLQIIEAMFRYLFEGTDQEKKVTVSSVTAVLLGGLIALAAVMFVLSLVTDFLEYPILIFLNYISYIVFSYMQKMARCEKKNVQVAISGVLNTLFMLGLQVLTLVYFHMRVDGMLLANALSYFAAAVYLNVHLHVERKISIRLVRKQHIKELLRYSFPLIPNSICWWFVSACDRYVISFFLSVSANGIYSIAGKFSQMLTMVVTVFQMAWQESSIIESDSASRNQFYTNTFNAYVKLLLAGYIALLPFIRLVMPYLVAPDYLSGYLYNPLLLLGAVFSALSQFYGSAYLAFKKTNGALSTTIAAASINCAVAVSLITKVGLFAPALGTTLAFFIQWLMRVYQMRDYFKVKIDVKMLSTLFIIAAVYTGLYYLDNVILQCVLFICGAVFFLYVNRALIKPILNKLNIGK